MNSPKRFFQGWGLLLCCFPIWSMSPMGFDDFYNPIGMAIHPSGEIFVVDSGNHRIVVLSSEGELKRTFGRKGSGPGEFQRPSSLAFLNDEKVLVVDSETRGIQIFSPQGTYLGLFLKPHHNVGHIYVTDQGWVLMTENDGIRFQFNTQETKAFAPVHVYDQTGTYQKGLFEGLVHDNHFVMAQRNHGTLAWHDKRLVFARYVENKMEVFDGNATNMHRYDPAFPPVEPDGQMKEKLQPDGSVSFRMVANTQVHSFDIAALDAKRLLMLRAMSEETDGIVETQLVILAWDGKLQKVLPGKFRAQKMALSPDKKDLYLLDENDDGWFVRKLAMADLL